MIGALHTATSRAHPAGAAVVAAMQAALEAVSPRSLVESALHGEGERLQVAGEALAPGRRVVIAIGKAAAAMVQPLKQRLGGALEGVVVTKHPVGAALGVPVVLGGHPLPDDASVAAGGRVGAAIDGLSSDDTVIVLVSGGASALVCDPPPGVSVADLRAVTSALLRAGADIHAMNTVRKHLDGLKGGRLAARARPARVIALALSDVPGDRLDLVASGPTVADRTTCAEAIEVLERHRVGAPAAVLGHLRAGAREERTSTFGRDRASLGHTRTILLAGNATAVRAAEASLRGCGFTIDAPNSALQGEASDAGRRIAEQLSAVTGASPRAIVAGGETVVHVRGPGRGGRNQEVALAAVERLAGRHQCLLATLATDGEDGPTDAAGAIVGGDTADRARLRGLDPARHLRENDAYTFFEALDDLVRPGPTGTNVCDLALAVYEPRTIP